MSPVYKFSNVGGFLTKNLYTSALAGNTAVVLDKGLMYPLGVFTLSSAQANVEFTNIPQTYTHLQIRFIGRCSSSGTAQDEVQMQMGNGTIDAGSNYAWHFLFGNGSSAGSTGFGSQTYMRSGLAPRTGSTGASFAGAVIDILDYRSTNKNKTIRSLTGGDLNDTNGLVGLCSGVWFPTTPVAVTNIRLKPEGASTFLANSSFALYGVQA